MATIKDKYGLNFSVSLVTNGVEVSTQTFSVLDYVTPVLTETQYLEMTRAQVNQREQAIKNKVEADFTGYSLVIENELVLEDGCVIS
jgi:hypothetical protein